MKRSGIALFGYLTVFLFPTIISAQSAAIDSSARPVPRRGVSAIVQTAANPDRFDDWLRGFRSGARARGISDRTLDAALVGVEYRQDVIARDRNQSEFTKQIWEYLESAVSEKRVDNGRRALQDHAATLARIEARYKVEAQVVAAIWGLESSYGTYRGDIPIVDALSTLAFEGRRAKFFADQLVAALEIVQAGDIAPRAMTGSWAGAMGHTQFIPTSFLGYAVDFGGDGRRDIWSDDPTDALASTAAYLARFGWTYGQPWGVEVVLPKGFDFNLAGSQTRKSARDWANLGVRTATGGAIPDKGEISILLPAGAQGVALAVYDNFRVIKRYNAADAYAIAVGHLGDRLRGGPALRADWPRGDRALKFSERQEMQRLLTRRGFDTQGTDGIIGPNTLRAVRQFQNSRGLVPDGYFSLDLLKRLE